MSNCSDYVDMPVCEHIVPVKFQCPKCNPLTLEKQIESLTDMYKHLSISIAGYQDHKVRQIDENRKISERMDLFNADMIALSGRIGYLDSCIEKFIKENERNCDRKPFKCPICEGKGKFWPEGVIGYDRCDSCEGRGYIWG